jgi:hypothetical protein
VAVEPKKQQIQQLDLERPQIIVLFYATELKFNSIFENERSVEISGVFMMLKLSAGRYLAIACFWNLPL